MNRTLIAIAAPLLLGAAVGAHAQSTQAPQQPAPTPPPAQTGASLQTRANVDAQIQQSACCNSLTTDGRQRVRVGSISALQGNVASVSADGSLTGSLTQNRTGAGADAFGIQDIRIGAVNGSVRGGSATAQGTVQGSVVQSLALSEQTNEGAVQLLNVGAIADSSGQALDTRGSLSGSVTQSQQGRSILQDVSVADVRGSTVQSATVNGAVVDAAIVQAGTAGGTTGASGFQVIAVGSLDQVNAQSVRTNGGVARAVTQEQNGRAEQRIEVGSVAFVGNGAAAGTIETDGRLLAPTTQRAEGAQRQSLRVGAVLGGRPADAQTFGLLIGSVTQVAIGGGAGGGQDISVGAVEGATGTVDASATVNANLMQSRSAGAGNSGALQAIHIGSARVTAGTVQTRAAVSGAIVQNLVAGTAGGQSTQTVDIGTVRGVAGTATTNAVFSGNLFQSNGGTSRQEQTVSLGSITAN